MVHWKVAFDAGRPEGGTCSHVGDDVPDVPPTSTVGCEDCLREGTRWVHLRSCLACGHVGCCDSSARKHAASHAEHAKHALARSLEKGETWAWCYEDDVFLTPDQG